MGSDVQTGAGNNIEMCPVRENSEDMTPTLTFYFDLSQVADLTLRLKQYEKMMIPPGNKPLDDRGNPRYHEGAWVPWQ